MAGRNLDMQVKSLYVDCCDLASYIANARREIAHMRPIDLKANKIPRAGMELDAIVKATEEATNTIMSAAERIMTEPSNGDLVNDACMRIFEACSFQDITGQRINKVVKTLKYIEDRLTKLQKAWGPELGFMEPEIGDPDYETTLLNGPQLEGEGVSQDDVDALLDRDSQVKPKGGTNSSQSDIDALFD